MLSARWRSRHTREGGTAIGKAWRGHRSLPCGAVAVVGAAQDAILPPHLPTDEDRAAVDDRPACEVVHAVGAQQLGGHEDGRLDGEGNADGAVHLDATKEADRSEPWAIDLQRELALQLGRHCGTQDARSRDSVQAA